MISLLSFVILMNCFYLGELFIHYSRAFKHSFTPLKSSQENEFKSGFVTILGNPNVGKSTLINKLLGQKLCIVTPKPQTTRHRIFGILTEPNYQIIFSDTPGVIENPGYKLQVII